MNAKHALAAVASAVLLLLSTVVMPAEAASAEPGDRLAAFLAEHAGTRWAGPAELWLDPAGDEAELSDARLRVSEDRIGYSWAWRGDPQTGEFLLTGEGLRWEDSWHQGEGVRPRWSEDVLAIFAVEYAYPAGEGPDWHWRMRLSRRPSGELVLQMTNVAPWGEEARAVRMVFGAEE